MKAGMPGSLDSAASASSRPGDDDGLQEPAVEAALDGVVAADGSPGGGHLVPPLVPQPVEPVPAQDEEAHLPDDGRRQARGESLDDVRGEARREVRLDADLGARKHRLHLRNPQRLVGGAAPRPRRGGRRSGPRQRRKPVRAHPRIVREFLGTRRGRPTRVGPARPREPAAYSKAPEMSRMT